VSLCQHTGVSFLPNMSFRCEGVSLSLKCLYADTGVPFPSTSVCTQTQVSLFHQKCLHADLGVSFLFQKSIYSVRGVSFPPNVSLH